MRAAIVLLSGGLDSMVCAALAREAGFSVTALTIDYGQRHRVELDAARVIAAEVGVVVVSYVVHKDQRKQKACHQFIVHRCFDIFQS